MANRYFQQFAYVMAAVLMAVTLGAVLADASNIESGIDLGYIIQVRDTAGGASASTAAKARGSRNGEGKARRAGLLAELSRRSIESNSVKRKLGRKESSDDDFEAVIEYEYGTVVNGFSGKFSEKALNYLRQHDDVVSIEKDGIAHAVGGLRGGRAPTNKRDDRSEAGASASSSTVEPRFVGSAGWGLDRIDQQEGVDEIYHYKPPACVSTDEGCHDVRLYVIDSGVKADHEDFGGRMSSGYDFVDDDDDSDDCDGHGTHVASTAAGETWGVEKAVDIIGVRVLDCHGNGMWSWVIAGIDWSVQNAKDNNVRAVLQISIGGGKNNAVNNAVENAVAAGALVVVSAGNNGVDACNRSPASAPNAITVGATMSNDAISDHPNWWASNHGPCVDIFAPGSLITAAGISSTTATDILSGTSMASPHVSGVVVKHLLNDPTATPAQIYERVALCDAAVDKISSVNDATANRLLQTTYYDAPLTQCIKAGNAPNGLLNDQVPTNQRKHWFDTPVIPKVGDKVVKEVKLSFKWWDQGTGETKGQMHLGLVKINGRQHKGVAMMHSGFAPHEPTQMEVTLTAEEFDVIALAEPGSMYFAFYTTVGEGKGRALNIDNFSYKITMAPAPTILPTASPTVAPPTPTTAPTPSPTPSTGPPSEPEPSSCSAHSKNKNGCKNDKRCVWQQKTRNKGSCVELSTLQCSDFTSKRGCRKAKSLSCKWNKKKEKCRARG